jgi:hypothetical protein
MDEPPMLVAEASGGMLGYPEPGDYELRAFCRVGEGEITLVVANETVGEWDECEPASCCGESTQTVRATATLTIVGSIWNRWSGTFVLNKRGGEDSQYCGLYESNGDTFDPYLITCDTVEPDAIAASYLAGDWPAASLSGLRYVNWDREPEPYISIAAGQSRTTCNVALGVFAGNTLQAFTEDGRIGGAYANLNPVVINAKCVRRIRINLYPTIQFGPAYSPGSGGICFSMYPYDPAVASMPQPPQIESAYLTVTIE